ncbi:biopolymer transporter ExbD [Parasulfuritortus cantonensis]|uniref:Biopolymer transporter ExbD n=1 Tax=Parasulfuritortus cantonensis TaxID=2528202 RepID=A0A4R1BMI6_9PROT|nr:biopolymer transporter ExbD [Parasulfuritortus cantonensis]TCJ18701.1 biopolymer transporter ExbD [Parasulfuritortus cantonensis]
MIARQAEYEAPRPVAEINVTPFIDVVLVLLVVFMITAPLAMASVPLKLPSSAAPPARPGPAPLVVSLTLDGRVYLDGDEVDMAGLAGRMGPLLAAEPARPVQVRADAALPYGQVAGMLGRLGALGASRLALITERGQP